MKQNFTILNLKQVKGLILSAFPNLKVMADSCEDIDVFKCELIGWVEKLRNEERLGAYRNLKNLIEFDCREVFELSTGTHVELNTISSLWHLLRGDDVGLTVDFAIDIYRQLERLLTEVPEKPSDVKVMHWMKRWPSGLNTSVMRIREANKQRIMEGLVEQIEHRHSETSRYAFPPDSTHEQKLELVDIWWNDYRFHLAMAVRSVAALNHLMDGTLSDETIALYHEAREKGMPIFITPYYLSLLNTTEKGYDDYAIRSYVFYSRNLVDTFGDIHAWEKEDEVVPEKPNAAGWILPEGGNIHRRYPDVAILIPDTMGRACGGLCASCQRMYDFQKGHLNFNLDKLRPKESWPQKLQRLMQYFEDDADLKDILITGGDALMSQNQSLHRILHAVYTMAQRKRRTNAENDANHQVAEIERVRLGTRLPVYLPMRINDELLDVLREFRIMGEAAGIKQFFIQTHFQTPLEVTTEARIAIKRLQSIGWTVNNQLVYNVAASRRGHTAKLRQVLNRLGVLCYYTFSVKGFEENHDVFTPNSRSLQEQLEEKSLGMLSAEQAKALTTRLLGTYKKEEALNDFCKSNDIPFVATDRSVLNLPGIGKSMTFSLVGIMPDGRRILMFDHDHTRRHSPVIEQMPKVFIKENKSIHEYLCQLKRIGENPKYYETIWQYTEGETEKRFPFYEYSEDR